MTKSDQTVIRELLSASIAHIEAINAAHSYKGRGVTSMREREKLGLVANDARIRLVKAQNAALAILNKRSGK